MLLRDYAEQSADVPSTSG